MNTSDIKSDLIELLRHDFGIVRTFAGIVLNLFFPRWPGSEEARYQVPEFMDVLGVNGTDPLGPVGPNPSDGSVSFGYISEYQNARAASATVLGLIGDARAAGPLIHALRDNDKNVRGASAKALGRIGNPKAVNALAGTLKDPKTGVRENAAKSLGQIGGERAVQALIHVLVEENKPSDWLSEGLYQEAAEGLGKIGDERALKHLLAGKKAREVGNSVFRSYDSVHLFPETVEAIGRAITGIIRANHKLKSEYPRLFCRTCLRRAKKIKLEYGTIILCPKCRMSRNLMTGISTVAGFIGGGGEDLFEQNGIAMVRLWFEEEKNARHADIDKIVIREGGVKNHEFALNAVILELTADASNKMGWTNRIPVETECSSPLSPACETMLKSNFKCGE